MEILYTLDFWIGLLTLTGLELVLGIDNLVFLSIVTSRLPKNQQKSARQLGLTLACLMRLALLATLSWMIHLTEPLFILFQQTFSGRDLVLIIGGLFLLVKATQEIHQNIEGFDDEKAPKLKKSSPHLYLFVILQIMFLDIIFSIDSVITAIGLTQSLLVMCLAIITAVILMIFASEPLSYFVNQYPTLKILALSFLILIGVVLIADGFQFHIPRGYLYFAMVFSIFVESINIIIRRKQLAAKIDNG